MKIEVKNTKKPIDYNQAMKFLEKRVNDVFLGKKDELLWIIEHKDVYTAGTSSKSEDLLNKNINVIKTGRGGKHTFHGPGQKVVYFVLNLNRRGKDIRNLINNVEKCIINILNEFHIKGVVDKKNIGIWVKRKNKKKKIAAIGIRIKKWIAFHGFALNVSNNLLKYDYINPCGIKDKGITSLQQMGIKNYKNIDKIIKKSFLNTFL